MRLARYVTCLVDLMRPSMGFASLRLLGVAGCDVVVPVGQICCGQPAWSAENRALAGDLARKAIAELAAYDYAVIPSGSCTEQIRNLYPQLLADDLAWRLRARALAARTYELSRFLAGRLILYRWAMRRATRYLNWLADDSGRIRIFGLAPGWTAGRDLTPPASKTFHELYAARKRA